MVTEGFHGWRVVVQRQMSSYGFTPAEQRVAWALFDVQTNRDIGEELETSPQTIKNHVYKMMQKTQTQNRLELVLLLLRLQDEPLPAAAQHAKKTHCKHGHEFTEANTYRRRDGRRVCRICAGERSHAYHQRRTRERDAGPTAKS